MLFRQTLSVLGQNKLQWGLTIQDEIDNDISLAKEAVVRETFQKPFNFGHFQSHSSFSFK